MKYTFSTEIIKAKNIMQGDILILLNSLHMFEVRRVERDGQRKVVHIHSMKNHEYCFDENENLTILDTLPKEIPIFG